MLFRSITGGVNTENGGGLCAGESSAVTLDHVEITDNTALFGGGILVMNATLTADELLLADNVAQGGAGMYSDTSTVSLVHARVLGNVATASNGGGIAFDASTADVQASIFSLNEGYSGGAMHVNDGSSVTLANLTMTENSSGNSAGGVRVTGAGTLAMSNTIIAWSSDGSGISGAKGATITVRNGDLWENDGGAVSSSYSDPTGLDGNLATNPLFVSFAADGADGDDLHLTAESPLVDAGDPAILDADGGPSDIGAYGGPYGA